MQGEHPCRANTFAQEGDGKIVSVATATQTIFRYFRVCRLFYIHYLRGVHDKSTWVYCVFSGIALAAN